MGALLARRALADPTATKQVVRSVHCALLGPKTLVLGAIRQAAARRALQGALAIQAALLAHCAEQELIQRRQDHQRAQIAALDGTAALLAATRAARA